MGFVLGTRVDAQSREFPENAEEAEAGKERERGELGFALLGFGGVGAGCWKRVPGVPGCRSAGVQREIFFKKENWAWLEE